MCMWRENAADAREHSLSSVLQRTQKLPTSVSNRFMGSSSSTSEKFLRFSASGAILRQVRLCCPKSLC